MKSSADNPLKGRTLYIHPMTNSGARLLAATFRSNGTDARIVPESDPRTLELGAMHSAGDECLPEKITMGDFLRITEMEDFDPFKTAFLMPTSSGPCRFGQYANLIKAVLQKLGLDDVLIVNPTSSNGYEGIGGNGATFFRTAWIGILCADIMRKMLNKIRPYEKVKGTTDAVYEKSLTRLEEVIEKQGMKFGERFDNIAEGCACARDEFRAIDADFVKGRPLIAVIGEIFCRHNRFANDNMLRKLEEHGAETWLSDIAEWVFYTDWTRLMNLRRVGKRFSKETAMTNMKTMVMKKDEHRLYSLFKDDFVGYEEPMDTTVMNTYSEPYLPVWGALGEMTLSLGKAGYSYHKGVDGIIDISPFSCMNGIVSEAVYPSFSKDHNNIPCRNFYYDGNNTDHDRDIGIYMELVKGYMRRKTEKRNYPACFIK